jgi:hypothetical protein
MKLSGMEDADRAVMWAEKAHGAAVRLHHVGGERNNVPRAARYFTERGYRQYDHIRPGILDDLSAKGVWAFCSYLFWPQRRAKDYYNL